MKKRRGALVTVSSKAVSFEAVSFEAVSFEAVSFEAVSFVIMTFAVSAVLFAGCSRDSGVLTFEEAFELVAEIPLDPDVLMAGGSGIDVDSAGRVLVADMQAERVFLFNPDGGLVQEYDNAACDPGEAFGPRQVLVLDRQRFVATTWNRKTYEFSFSDGCVRNLTATLPEPRSYCRTPSGDIYVFYYEPPRGRVIRYTKTFVPTDTLVLHESAFRRLNTTFSIFQYLACHESDEVLYTYAESGVPRYLSDIATPAWSPPSFFRPISNEVETAPRGVDGFLDGQKKSFANGLFTSAIMALGDGRVVTHYRLMDQINSQYKTFYYVKSDADSIEVEVERGYPTMLQARDGYLYSMVFPGRDSVLSLENADHPNPVVLKFGLRN